MNTQGGFYGTALQAASFLGHVAAVKSLLRSGADTSCSHAVQVRIPFYRPNVQVCNALHAASLRGHGAVVELLLNHGVVSQHLDIALDAALGHGFNYVAESLIKHGAKQK